MADEELGVCAQVRKQREGALPYWRPLWDARREERAFLDGDRYVEPTDLYEKDRRRRQFRGQQTSNVNRHKTAKATAAPRNLEALPVDRNTDPDDAEIAVSILEWELNHPQKCFDDVLEEVVQDAIDCRAGCAMLEYDPDKGKWGETYWAWHDANLVMFEPGFVDPHHLACGWLQVVKLMPIAKIEAMGKIKGKGRWLHTADLRPDGEVLSYHDGATNPDGSPRIIMYEASTQAGVPGVARDQESVWVLFCWYKDDPSTYKRQVSDPLIPEGDRYMACDNPGCTYRSDTQDTLLEEGKLGEGETLPDTMEPCPMCGGHLSRRDVYATEEEVLAYPKGRRLVIQPLLQRLPDDEPFYDGAWPVPNARSFPILWVTSYCRPGRPMGPSDTTLNWDAQIASDQLMTMAFDRMMRHQTYYVMDRVGFFDIYGNRFEMRDDQSNIILKDRSNTLSPNPTIEVLDGSSLDPYWSSYWNAVQQVLKGEQGITDLGTPEQRSQQSGVALQTTAAVEELPVEHFKRRMHRACGKGFGVHWDYIRKTYPTDRLARLNISDEQLVAPISGDELPNFDFIIMDTPEFSGLDKARMDAFQTLFQIAQQSPEWLDVFAEINKFPPSIVRRVKKKLADIQAQQQADAEVQAQAGDFGQQPGTGAEQGPGTNPFEAVQGMRGAGPDDQIDQANLEPAVA